MTEVDWFAASDVAVARKCASLPDATATKHRMLDQLTAVATTRPANSVHAANMMRTANGCLDQLLAIRGR